MKKFKAMLYTGNSNRVRVFLDHNTYYRGVLHLEIGDYLVKDEKGCVYKVSKTEFEKMYIEIEKGVYYKK